MMRKMKTPIGIFMMSILLATGLSAQDIDNSGACASTSKVAQIDNTPITCGIFRKIQSKVLGEERAVLVFLPVGYEKSDKAFPVLYKLDGDRDISLQAFSALNYLVDMTDRAPAHIVVGIENTNRRRDMGKEADKFIQFIETELIPFIDTNYRTHGYRILCGQSLSSVFAFNVFLKKPDLFDAYILASFGLRNTHVEAMYKKDLENNPSLKTVGKKFVFVTNGRKDSYDPDGSIAQRGERFLESMKQTVSATVSVKSVYYDNEGHVPFSSIYDGLQWIYSKEMQEENKTRGE